VVTPPQPASLDALRDIHLPQPVSLWPPAPGWWLLLALLLTLAAATFVWLRRRRQRPLRWQRAALRELDELEARHLSGADPSELAAALSALLRRGALARFGAEVASLHGEPWVELLCRPSGSGRSEPEARSPRVLEDLTATSYAGERAARGDVSEWISFTRLWIEEST
jgi:Domain of unknown function (DUF4381)